MSAKRASSNRDDPPVHQDQLEPADPILQPAGFSDLGENCSAELLVHHAEIIT